MPQSKGQSKDMFVEAKTLCQRKWQVEILGAEITFGRSLVEASGIGHVI